MPLQFVMFYVAGAQCHYKEAFCFYQRALVINLCWLGIISFWIVLLIGCIDLNFFPEITLLTFVEIQTLLKITRPVVLWLKEMVMMVSRRGSESNIKSDLSIWARYLFKHSLNMFMV